MSPARIEIGVGEYVQACLFDRDGNDAGGTVATSGGVQKPVAVDCSAQLEFIDGSKVMIQSLSQGMLAGISYPLGYYPPGQDYVHNGNLRLVVRST